MHDSTTIQRIRNEKWNRIKVFASFAKTNQHFETLRRAIELIETSSHISLKVLAL